MSRRGGVALVALSLVVLAIGPAQPKLRTEPKPPAFWPPPALSRERAVAVTVRIDSSGGGAFDTGTGVGIGAHVVLTNAHLTQEPVTLVTRCGDVNVPVEHIDRAADGTDLAVVTTSGPNLLPVELAAADPQPGDKVLLAGYPNGVLTLTDGHVEGVLVRDGETTIRFSPEPEIGQSGSPLLDADGRIAGLVVARDEVGGQGLAIPASTLRSQLDQFRAQNVPIADPASGDPSAVPARSSPCG